MLIRRWCMFLPTIQRLSTGKPPIHIILTLIPAGTREWDWRGVPVSHGPPERGAATGVIAIGATATSTLTTITILIGIIGITSTTDRETDRVRAIDLRKCQREGSGATIQVTVGMRRTEIAGLRIDLVKLAIVHPLCPQAEIVQGLALALVRIGPRLNRLVEIVPVAVQPRIGPRLSRPAEVVPVAVQPQIGHRLDRQVAVERIKLAIAASRRVREAAERLVVAAEILRARAARAAAAAWAAVDSAVAVVAVAA